MRTPTAENKARQAAQASPLQSYALLPWALKVIRPFQVDITFANGTGFVGRVTDCTEADLNHIVRSVNNAERLAEACRSIANDYTMTDEPFPSAIVRQSSVKSVKAALAAYEKENQADTDATRAAQIKYWNDKSAEAEQHLLDLHAHQLSSGSVVLEDPEPREQLTEETD